MRSLLFVCTANICRSPTAAAVFRHLAVLRGRVDGFEITSAGTHDYHSGQPAFPLAVTVARAHGIDLSQHIARQIRGNDFDQFDMILAMDNSNLRSLKAIAPSRCKHKIELLLEYGDAYHGMEIPDPYGGQHADFELARTMIADGCKGLANLFFR